QMLVAGPHRDLRRARAAAVNIVPTTTGAARTVGRVMPHLAGKLDGLAVRVPVPAGSIIDFTFTPRRETTLEEVNEVLARAAESSPYLEYSTDELVSTDIVGTTASAIVDSQLTMAVGQQIKVVAWYDNEWGYTNRPKDMRILISHHSHSGGHTTTQASSPAARCWSAAISTSRWTTACSPTGGGSLPRPGRSSNSPRPAPASSSCPTSGVRRDSRIRSSPCCRSSPSSPRPSTGRSHSPPPPSAPRTGRRQLRSRTVQCCGARTCGSPQ